jgi:hypothetical protein
MEALVDTSTKDPEVIAASDSPHTDTIRWLATQPGLLADLAGEWVALDQRTIIAHDPSIAEVVRLARERGVNDPLLVPVPPPGYVTG